MLNSDTIHEYVELQSYSGSDLDFVNSAKVSFNSQAHSLGEQEISILNFLVREKHGSPFEHSFMKFKISAPLFVVREWQRHRTGSSFNEISGRYTTMPAVVPYHPVDSHNMRSQEGKPGSYSFKHHPSSWYETEQCTDIETVYDFAYDTCLGSYQQLMDMGVPKELARCVLPLASFTEFIWTCNARSLMHFLSLRNSSNAQHEIRLYAKHLEEIFSTIFPVTWSAFIENGRIAP